jgi:hypothetical protein
MMRAIHAVLVLTAACGLLGCSGALNTAAGPGDDFPNSKSVLGKALAEGIGLSSDWVVSNQVPDTLSDSLTQGITTAESLLVQPARTKKSSSIDLANETYQWNLSDSAKGYVLLYYSKDGLTAITQDTLKILYHNIADTAAGVRKVLTVSGNEYYRVNANNFSYHIIDSDTNGFFDHGTVLLVMPQIGFTSVVSAAGTSGNDNNFTDKSKLRISSVHTYTISGYDTLSMIEIDDADHDGAIYDSTAARNIIDVRVRSINVSRLTPVYLSGIAARIDIGTAKAKTVKPIRYAWLSTYNDGHAEDFWMRGNRPDSSFQGLDTATAVYTRYVPDQGGLDTITGTYSVVLDRDFPVSLNNRLLSFSLSRKLPRDTIISLQLSVVFSSPLLPGETLASKSGIFDAAVIVGGTNATATVNGSFTKDIIEGRYTAPDGTTRDFIWDRNGN